MSANTLTGFDEALPLTADDAAFVSELRALLERHGNLDRFGVCLLHEHFAVEDNEILLETNDPERRVLTVTPENAETLPEFKATMWRLLADPPAGGADGRAYQVLQGTVVEILQGCAQDKCK
ncbi:MAG: hypothetical protein ACLQBY_03305 [Solirubrobacteraceae bacterium]